MAEIPIPSLCFDPPNPKKFQIPLPFGGSLKPLVDMSKGPPSDCELVHSLMLQLTPMLAGMECMLRVLNVIVALKATAESGFTKIGDLIDAINDLTDCFGLLSPSGIGKLIAAILRIIIAYLNCFIDAFMSIYTFSAELDITEAGDNPVFLNSVQCAKQNSDKSMDTLMGTMEGAQSLMEILDMIAKIGNLPLKLPSLSDIAGEEDPLEAIEKLRDMLEELEQIADSLPV